MQVIDLFAGGGGASEGIFQALGISPTLAVNHDPKAIAMHARNHPRTIHLTEDLFKLQPQKPRRGAVDLLWASPDCCHHSRAKGGKPLETGRRLLPWVVVEWAREVHPKVLIVENVAELQDWGPLGPDDRPIKARKGETWLEFLSALRLAGYRVEFRVLNAADYGAPTARKRLFLIGRSDGQPIVWPEPTHGPGRSLPHRAAAECIDWSIPNLSIFATRAQAKVWARETDAPGIPNRPLAIATQRRIAAGVQRFVLNNPRPFVVSIDHGSSVAPVRSVDDPISTTTTKARHALVVPYLATTSNGEREGQAPRIRDITRPLGTVCATGSQGALVSAWLAKHNGSGDRWNAAIGSSLHDPIHTITTTDSKALATVSLDRDPIGNARAVAAFLTKFFGPGTGFGQRLDEPLHTVRTGDCFGLVTVTLDGEQYVVTDIGMRMLTPRELALAQGFDHDYILTGSKRDQVARVGNSVCPPVAAAIVRAQFGISDSRLAA